MPLQSIPPARVTWNYTPSDDGAMGVALDGRLVFSFFNAGSTRQHYTCTITNPESNQNMTSSRYSLGDTRK